MRFLKNKQNTTWTRFFVWFPIYAGRVGDNDVYLWLEIAEFRYVDKGKLWCNAAWECRPLDTPDGFVSELQAEGQWV
jgi:hypothetical protein